MLFSLTQRWKWCRIKFWLCDAKYNHIFKLYYASHLSTELRIIWWSLFITCSYYNNEHIIYWHSLIFVYFWFWLLNTAYIDRVDIYIYMYQIKCSLKDHKSSKTSRSMTSDDTQTCQFILFNPIPYKMHVQSLIDLV